MTSAAKLEMTSAAKLEMASETIVESRISLVNVSSGITSVYPRVQATCNHLWDRPRMCMHGQPWCAASFTVAIYLFSMRRVTGRPNRFDC